MTVSLNLVSLSRKLNLFPERSIEDVKLPEGVSREDFELFMRVMEAETPADIKDIPADKIADMFSYATSILDCINEAPYLNEALFGRLMKCQSAEKRRCL